MGRIVICWPKIARGSGNVFADLGFSGALAESLALRAQLMSEIREVVDHDILRVMAQAYWS